MFEDDIEAVLLDAGQIQRKVAELAARISADHSAGDLLLVGILKGALVLMSDLTRALTVPHEIDFMAVSSYGSATQVGQVGAKTIRFGIVVFRICHSEKSSG